ncbi:MAG TPA: alanine--tRNA ligase-related protein, partial [Pyrinomonadaceae bacterium]|nr:alanine--tRNA ligase-related protein [Pyrinomonadaceae bacterium]
MSVYAEMTESQQFACRVIADHARATAFAIADGILPGNEGRNYVLRKIMRRAIYHGREHLGFKEPFFYKVCDFVIDQMHQAYPELEAQREFIGKMVRLEEERFGNTLTVGLRKLNELIDSKGDSGSIFSHEIAPIKDTFGLPGDLIFVVLQSRKAFVADFQQQGSVDNLVDDPDLFNQELDKAVQFLQKHAGIGQTERKTQINPIFGEILEKVGPNKFHGYETTQLEGATVSTILDGDKQIDALAEGQQGSVIL